MYRAAVSDYVFLFRHVIEGERLLADVLPLDDVADVLGHAGTFAAEVIAPLNAPGDQVGSRFENGEVITPDGFPAAYHAFVEAGWNRLGLPVRAGGEGMPALVNNAVTEFWSAAGAAFSMASGLSNGAILAIDAAAGEDVRAAYLPKMVSGQWTGTMNLTEPQSGTDLATIKTTARPTEDGNWSVTGQKIFISWGDHDLTDNIVHLVLARTPDAPDGLAGLSLFLVPKYLPGPDGEAGERNRVTTVSIEHKLGIKASPTCVLDYDGSTGFLIGERDKGLAAMFVMMNEARQGVAVQALGVADRAYQQAVGYAQQRLQGAVLERPAGTPIAEHPDVRRLLLSMGSVISAMRALSVQLGAWFDEPGQRALAEFFVPVFKGWLTETAVQVTSDAVQVHGGMGFIEETGAAQHYRDIRILPIYEGTTAIQANDLIGRKLVRDEGVTAGKVLDLIAASLEPLRGNDNPVALRTVTRLENALATARVATDDVLRHQPRDRYAVSVPYLHLLGLLAGGWMHARILTATLAHPDAETERRVREVDFYGAHHLSRIASLAEAVEAGEIG